MLSCLADHQTLLFDAAAPARYSCVAKFFAVNTKVGEQMQAIGAQRSAGGGGGGSFF